MFITLKYLKGNNKYTTSVLFRQFSRCSSLLVNTVV